MVPTNIAAEALKPLTLLQRMQHRMKNRPSIDVNLVRANEVLAPFSFSEPQEVSKQFDVHEALGEGTTGVVYRATRHRDGREVALKMMRMHDEELFDTARQEFELLRSIKHPHIIEVFDFFSYRMGAVLVLAYFAGKALDGAVSDAPGRCLPEETAQRLFKSLVLAVDHLHQLGIIHRDVKASNILVSKDLSDLKLVDFNTARRVLEGGALTMTGTVDYMPPEVLLGDSHSEKSDIWAAGLCLHLMLAGKLPMERRLFSCRDEFVEALASQEVHVMGQELQCISKPCKAVLHSCLAKKPEMRIAAKDILSSAWLGTEQH